MTVQELIDRLEREHPDMEVRVGKYESYMGEYKLTSVSIDDPFVTDEEDGYTCDEERSERMHDDDRARRVVLIY